MSVHHQINIVEIPRVCWVTIIWFHKVRTGACFLTGRGRSWATITETCRFPLKSLYSVKCQRYSEWGYPWNHDRLTQRYHLVEPTSQRLGQPPANTGPSVIWVYHTACLQPFSPFIWPGRHVRSVCQALPKIHSYLYAIFRCAEKKITLKCSLKSIVYESQINKYISGARANNNYIVLLMALIVPTLIVHACRYYQDNDTEINEPG